MDDGQVVAVVDPDDGLDGVDGPEPPEVVGEVAGDGGEVDDGGRRRVEGGDSGGRLDASDAAAVDELEAGDAVASALPARAVSRGLSSSVTATMSLPFVSTFTPTSAA